MRRYWGFVIGACILWSSITPATSCAAGIPANPILVLGTKEYYVAYIGEVLKAQGFNEFQIESISDPSVTARYLEQFDIVVLGETPLTAIQKDMFAHFVDRGGNLIAFRPDKHLASVLGLNDAGETIGNGYLKIDTATDEGAGFISDTLQFHTVADCYNLDGAAMVATLFSDSSSATTFPAVTFNNYGRGHAAVFTYNLIGSIIETRQGNWRVAGQERDGINGLRAMDMFANGWVDASKNGLNQADEQMRLFSRLIEIMAVHKRPLPRFWYFPDDKLCYVVLTNDTEDNTGTELDSQVTDIQNKGARMSLYILDTRNISKAQTDAWHKNGHEIAAHPGYIDNTRHNSYAAKPTWSEASAVVQNTVNQVDALYGYKTSTVVNHWFVWCGVDSAGSADFSAMAKILVNNGIELDGNYAQYDNGSPQGAFLGGRTNAGNFTGSGLPMKMADLKGNIVNIYQLLNNVYDQEYMEADDAAGFYTCFKTIMDRSLTSEVYSWIHLKSHRAEWGFSRDPVLRMLDYANANRIPVVTAKKCLDFMKMKDVARFRDIVWSGNHLSFILESSRDAGVGLTFMVPASCSGKNLNGITGNGARVDHTYRTLKSKGYAFVTVSGGNNYRIVATYK